MGSSATAGGTAVRNSQSADDILSSPLVTPQRHNFARGLGSSRVVGLAPAATMVSPLHSLPLSVTDRHGCCDPVCSNGSPGCLSQQAAAASPRLGFVVIERRSRSSFVFRAGWCFSYASFHPPRLLFSSSSRSVSKPAYCACCVSFIP